MKLNISLSWLILTQLVFVGIGFRIGFGKIGFRKYAPVVPSPQGVSTRKSMKLKSGFLSPAFEHLASTEIEWAQAMKMVDNAIQRSATLFAKYPDPAQRSSENVLAGLSNVIDIEYLSSLPKNHPFRRFLATIEDPGEDRRKELDENLLAIDIARGSDAILSPTRKVFEKLGREDFATMHWLTLEQAASLERSRRQQPEYLEYNPEDPPYGSFADENFKQHDSSMFFSDIMLNGPDPRPTNITEREMERKRAIFMVQMLRTYIPVAIHDAINKSTELLAKYPDPADRTVHKVLGGLMNIADIDYLTSLPPEDPRRGRLAHLKNPSAERRAELEENIEALEDMLASYGMLTFNSDSVVRGTYAFLAKCSIDLDEWGTFKDGDTFEMFRRLRCFYLY